MRKKFLALILCISLLGGALPVKAFIAIPFFTITINQHAEGGDDSFVFDVSGGTPETFFTDQPSILTEGGLGSVTLNTTSPNGARFVINQEVPAGWGNPAYTCSSNNPAITYVQNVGEPGVSITSAPFSSITCDVINTKQSQAVSNVLFIPGFEGSRLYKKGTILNPEDQLWEPLNNSDVQDLYFNNKGKSINKIYTKDIIGSLNYPFYHPSIYQELVNQMNQLVANGMMNHWEAFPYDWRYKIEDVVNSGTALPNNVTVNLIASVESEAKQSKTGKVTIIGHSNGGLIAKILVEALTAKHEENLVDNVILVAVPQLGTPKTVPSLLHGDWQSFGKGFVLTASIARKFGANIPSSYNLLPSKKYFSVSDTPVITFDESIGTYGNWRQKYGASIDTPSEFLQFLLGLDGRKKPGDNDLLTPNVLDSSLYADAISTHNNIDTWVPPQNIHVYQIAGWGIDTISSLKYVTTHFFSAVPTRAPIGKNDGDDTVVLDSAITDIPNSENFYVDLSISSGATHATIFNSDSVRLLLNNILIPSTNLPDGVSRTKPTDIHGFVTIEIHSPVDIDLYDEAGNHTGLAKNPIEGSDLKFVEQNIPGTTYVVYGEDKYITIDQNKKYTLILQGIDQGLFTLQITDSRTSNTVVTSFSDIPTSEVMKGKMDLDLPSGNYQSLSIDENGDGVTESTLNPSEPFNPKLYLDLLRTTILNLQLKPKFEKDILVKIGRIEHQLEKGKIAKATKELKNFVSKIDFGKGRLKSLSQGNRELLANQINVIVDKLQYYEP